MAQPGRKPTVIVFAKYYAPAYKAGGPIRSVQNITEHLGDAFDFRIITQDRDYGDAATFDGITPNQWSSYNGVEVYYASPGQRTPWHWWRILREVRYDALYVGSMFAPHFSIAPLMLWRLGLLRSVPFVLAPRGEFSPEALALKRYKKQAYIRFMKLMRWHQAVRWHASTPDEAEAIRTKMGEDITVHVARNLPSRMPNAVADPALEGKDDALHIVLMGRVAPMKNIDYALNVLQHVAVPVQLRIYGAITDGAYWVSCEEQIAGLPDHITVSYEGVVPHTEVGTVLASHDLLFLPSRGENFGHVIYEALACGCPVLISDRTPWQSLDTRGGGWILSLARPDDFRAVIERVAAADPAQRNRWSREARAVASEEMQNLDSLVHHHQLFDTAPTA